MIRLICSCLVILAIQVVRANETLSYFAVGPLPSGIVLPLKFVNGVHSGVGKCLKEVKTSPSGNGSSLVERCCYGYKRYKYNQDLCVPKCNSKCTNGFCLAPNICMCFIDHTRSLDNECVATCPIGCLNGRCQWNGKCICNRGFKLEPNKQFCIPHCSSGDCGLNANCTAPEICSCLPGFHLNSSQICEPICSPSCGNGICEEPNQCKCFAGFVLKDKSCQANCTRGCQNGRCVANDICVCDSGYKLVENGTKCEPICSQNCEFGNCTRPGICSCFQGYTNIKGICKPSCKSGCVHGDCVAPETCVCPPRYNLNGNTCKPVCSNRCLNGKCISPDVCKCNRNYVKILGMCVLTPRHSPSDSFSIELPTNPPTIDAPKFHPTLFVQPVKAGKIVTNQTALQPHCNRSCLNGICSGQNLCKCNAGYAMEFGSWHKCTPYCPGGCPNGQCTAPHFCTCNFGFVKTNGTCNYLKFS